jgi:hypothetical protein
MLDVIVKAAKIPLNLKSADPFEQPLKKHDTLIVGGTHILPLAAIVPKYAVKMSILIPQDIPELDREIEMGRAMQFEETSKGFCTGAGFARDLGGVNTDSLDLLIIASIYPEVREKFLAQAWRVVREFGKVIVFSQSEIPLTHLGSFGIAAPSYYPSEGFYIGTMRKAAAVRARN